MIREKVGAIDLSILFDPLFFLLALGFQFLLDFLLGLRPHLCIQNWVGPNAAITKTCPRDALVYAVEMKDDWIRLVEGGWMLTDGRALGLGARQPADQLPASQRGVLAPRPLRLACRAAPGDAPTTRRRR